MNIIRLLMWARTAASVISALVEMYGDNRGELQKLLDLLTGKAAPVSPASPDGVPTNQVLVNLASRIRRRQERRDLPE